MRYRRTRPPLLRARDSDPSEGRRLRRLHAAGKLVRLRANVYIAADVWAGLAPADRHLTRAWAIGPDLSRTAVFSHQTAALIHGWALIGGTTDRVHVVDDAVRGVEHRAGVVRHGLGQCPFGTAPARFDGVPVADALTTAVLLALTMEPHVAAVAIDSAVRAGELDVARFEAALPEGPARGSRRARLVAAALDPLHESVGESYTAIRLVEIGLRSVEPQREFRSGRHVDRVDFWLPEQGVVVEFDGKQKYVDPAMLGDRSPQEVLWQEKLREDRLRRRPEVTTIIRVTWWHLVDLDRFLALFRSHGVFV
ncbi:hypothetical protein DEJ28_12495 [Curtobacterium sp. MCPF17_002]|uniref:hypothetical protein n=1 Tax=Curtobacterium sp. MCPF17_002 TaxID=2175645 RepID=UPI0011B4A680|nr:hypothetical protein [Curtobacterium sp. MCPF17_002]WIB76477.1 hypothetical protein DEJ28_12495 [Curtobacterium sp. MCPF17_002]